jgi:hypothetical protein
MQSFLIYTAIILGIIAFARVIKVYELANALRGNEIAEFEARTLRAFFCAATMCPGNH